MTVTLFAPAGVANGSQVLFPDGSSATVAADGSVVCPIAFVTHLLSAGWTITGTSIAAGAAIAFSQIAKMLSNRILNSPALAIGTTDRNVANGAFDYQIGAAAGGVNTFKKKVAVAAGTALSAGTIPIDQWGLYLFSVAANGTITCTGAAANGTTGYASEAAAIAALPATPAADAPMGYVTVKTHAGTTFVAGTDSLTGGAAGNVAANTNYYNAGLAY